MRTAGAGLLRRWAARAPGAVLAVALLAVPAGAAEWGSVRPGVTTTEGVRARWGAPSKETRQKVEGYDTVQWVYEEDRAPEGLKRMIVDFGLLAPTGYQPAVVRLLTLEPKPGIFGPNTVIQGWGEPDAFRGKAKEDLSLFYHDGLLVFFDKEDFAYRMVFSVPQPVAPGEGAPPAAAPPGGPAPAPARPPAAPGPRR